MNIIFLRSQNPFSTSSAAANRYLTLIEGLASLGVTVRLLVTDGFQSEQEKKQFGTKGNLHSVHYEYVFPFVVSGYWFKRLFKYILQPAVRIFFTKKLRRRLQKEPEGTIMWPSFDKVQLHALYPKLTGRLYFAESNEFPDIHHHNQGNILQRWVADNEENFFKENIFPILDGMALMTHALMQFYNALPAPSPKLLHLPMTVDLARFNRQLSHIEGFQKPYIVYVGVMNNAKDGVDILIEAFAAISSQFPDYRLYLVGPWHYDTPGHKKSISDLGLADRVFWMGEYNRDAIPAILTNANLLVLPRPDSKQAQGGFPTKLGEYLASGNPVCATMVGEIPDYLVDGESVYFAEPGSVDSFAGAMQRALSNPEQSGIVGANGRKVAETRFNKEMQAKILFDFLKKLGEK